MQYSLDVYIFFLFISIMFWPDAVKIKFHIYVSIIILQID